jgi:predicted  nucleic acid-binding Zn-ribbon protein
MKKIDKRMTAVGKERDKIDYLLADLEMLREDCNEACEALQEARDSLSRLV